MKKALEIIGLLAFVAALILAGIIEAVGGTVPIVLAAVALAIMTGCTLAAERR